MCAQGALGPLTPTRGASVLDDPLQSREDKQPVQSHPGSDSQISPSPLTSLLAATQTWDGRWQIPLLAFDPPHLTHGEMEAQRGQVSYPESHECWVVEKGPFPGIHGLLPARGCPCHLSPPPPNLPSATGPSLQKMSNGDPGLQLQAQQGDHQHMFLLNPCDVTATRLHPPLSQQPLPSSPRPFLKLVPSDLASGPTPQEQKFWICVHLLPPSCPSSFPCTPYSQGRH